MECREKTILGMVEGTWQLVFKATPSLSPHSIIRVRILPNRWSWWISTIRMDWKLLWLSNNKGRPLRSIPKTSIVKQLLCFFQSNPFFLSFLSYSSFKTFKVFPGPPRRWMIRLAGSAVWRRQKEPIPGLERLNLQKLSKPTLQNNNSGEKQ